MKRWGVFAIGVTFLAGSLGVYYVYLDAQEAQAEYDYFSAKLDAYSRISSMAVPEGVDKFGKDAPSQQVTAFFVYSKLKVIREDAIRSVLEMHKIYHGEVEKLLPPATLQRFHQSYMQRHRRQIELWEQALLLVKNGDLSEEVQGIAGIREELKAIQDASFAEHANPRYQRFWDRYQKEIEQEARKEAKTKTR